MIRAEGRRSPALFEHEQMARTRAERDRRKADEQREAALTRAMELAEELAATKAKLEQAREQLADFYATRYDITMTRSQA